jgi:hypothetical protein
VIGNLFISGVLFRDPVLTCLSFLFLDEDTWPQVVAEVKDSAANLLQLLELTCNLPAPISLNKI